jgi:hypothetical protein
MVRELCFVIIMESGSGVEMFWKEKKKETSLPHILASGF